MVLSCQHSRDGSASFDVGRAVLDGRRSAMRIAMDCVNLLGIGSITTFPIGNNVGAMDGEAGLDERFLDAALIGVVSYMACDLCSVALRIRVEWYRAVVMLRLHLEGERASRIADGKC